MLTLGLVRGRLSFFSESVTHSFFKAPFYGLPNHWSLHKAIGQENATGDVRSYASETLLQTGVFLGFKRALGITG